MMPRAAGIFLSAKENDMIRFLQKRDQNSGNQQLLQKYKEKHILKFIQFPIFSKEMKLIFHMN